MSKVQLLPIKMDHAHKERVRDSQYGTGDWLQGETKLVTPEQYAKMIRHIDVWVPGKAEDAAETAATAVRTVAERTQQQIDQEALEDLRQKVQTMSRDQVIEYAAVHYKLKIPGNSSLENARAELTRHIDIAGVA